MKMLNALQLGGLPANKALIKFLAKRMGVPAGAIAIVSGEHARDKVVEVAGVTAARARSAVMDEK